MPPKVALLEREWNDTFGHSECTDAYLDDNFISNFGPRASARSPGSGLVPRPLAGEAVVFLDFFKYGVRVPAHPFVAQVLKAFQLEIHQLTPNAIAKLAIYVWVSFEQDDDPIEFALDSDYEGHGLPSLTPSEVFPSAAVMGDVEKVLPDILFAKERKQLSGVHYGHLFQALYANQVKVFPVFGAIEDQFFYFRNRLRQYRQRFRDTRSELRKKDSEERKVSSSLFKACKDLRDCLLYLGGEVQDFPLPNASNREFAEWISANSSFAKSTAENFGVLARAAGIEEAFAQLSLSGGSVDPILDEVFSPAKELPDPIPDEARSSFFKMASHWQDVGSGRVSSFVEKFRENQNSAASDDPADDVPEE
ncbi:hypothetical protein EJB05_49247, partial [Eragrostis curvula]